MWGLCSVGADRESFNSGKIERSTLASVPDRQSWPSVAPVCSKDIGINQEIQSSEAHHVY